MIDETQIAELLRSELAIQTRHCKILEAQERALLAGDRTRFIAIQQEYASLVERLKVQGDARITMLQDEDGQPVTLNALLDELPEADQKPLVDLRDRVHACLDRAQRLCQRNEKLITNELRYIAFALDLFVEAGRRADDSYGGRGRFARRRMLDRQA